MRLVIDRPSSAPLFGLVNLLLLGSAAGGQGPETASSVASPEPLTVERASGEIAIDGELGDPGWESATESTLDYEYVPGDNVEPPVETTVLLTYDDDHVYVAFRAADPEPDRIRAHLMDRDEISTLVQDDHVVLMIDTFDDDRRAYQFRANPLGVQADAFNSEIGGGEDWSFDLIWDSAGRITEEGYVVEIAIPLNQLRFPAGRGELTWGVRLGRSWPRNVRHRMANHPVDRDESCVICQLPSVVGFAGIEPGLNLELTPTLTASRTDERRELPAGELEEGSEEIEPGITGRWGITPSLTLHGTVNPDFSQVEADVAQLNVNERFALFFPEKRPFFLEGADLFDTPIDAVFTRTVVDPGWGLKLTGKQERSSGGLLVAEDEVNSLVIPANQGSSFAFVEDDVLATIARYRRDVGTGSSLGLLYAGREGTGYHNRVGGLDGFLRFGDSDTLRFQYLRSDTRYPPELGLADGSLTDDGIEAWYNHTTRSWYWLIGYKDLGPDFRADSGFEPRVDLRNVQASLGRQFWGTEEDWYTTWNVGGTYTRIEDHDGRLTDEDFQVDTFASGPLQSNLFLAVQSRTRLSGDVLIEDRLRGILFVELQPASWLRLSSNLVAGETFDFANHRPADVLFLAPRAEIKPGRRVNLQLSHTLQDLDVEGSDLTTANLSQLRLVYNFNVRTFFRAIVQYRNAEREPSLYRFPVEPTSESLSSQLLLSYKLNPRTVLFLGYTENQLGLDRFDLVRTDRTFFFKLGYAWTL